MGNINFHEVHVLKDTTGPQINILELFDSIIYGEEAPTFNISINELTLNSIWYTMDGGITNYPFIGNVGIINQTAWDLIRENLVFLRFYAYDSAGRIGYAEIKVAKMMQIKDPTEKGGNGNDNDKDTSSHGSISFGNFYVLSTIIAIINVIYLMKKRRK